MMHYILYYKGENMREDITEKTVRMLDWATRKIRAERKRYPFGAKDISHAVHLYGRLYGYCDILDINTMDWCNKVKIPYYVITDGWFKEDFYFKESPFNPSLNPIERNGKYIELINKTIKERG